MRKGWLRLLLIYSGDVELNPGPGLLYTCILSHNDDHVFAPFQAMNHPENAHAECRVHVLHAMERNGITERFNHTSLSWTHFKKPQLQLQSLVSRI